MAPITESRLVNAWCASQGRGINLARAKELLETHFSVRWRFVTPKIAIMPCGRAQSVHVMKVYSKLFSHAHRAISAKLVGYQMNCLRASRKALAQARL